MAERVMPHNLDAEQSVLGSMFLSKYALQKGVESLNKELFYLDAHAKIFAVLSDLLEKNIPVDLTIVTDELSNRGWLKQIGDVDYLMEVINSVPTAANVDEYIKIVNEKAILRRLIEEATNIVTEGYNGNEELSEILDNAEKKILSVVKTRKGSEFRTLQEVLLKTQADLDKLSQRKGEVTGLATGFYDLDKVTSGFHSNELIIIAARPAMGKTALAVNLAVNIAKNNSTSVALFNMEMGAEQLVTRMISSAGQIDGYKLRNGSFEHNDWKRINEAVSRLSLIHI